MKTKPFLKTWSPIIGGVLLIAVAGLHAFGQHDAASTLVAIVGALGLGQGAPISEREATELVVALVAAFSLAAGIVRKFIAVIRRAREASDVVRLPR